MVSGTRTKNKRTRILKKISPKNIPFGSEIRKNSSRIRIQGVKKHRIPDPDPQHYSECLKITRGLDTAGRFRLRGPAAVRTRPKVQIRCGAQSWLIVANRRHGFSARAGHQSNGRSPATLKRARTAAIVKRVPVYAWHSITQPPSPTFILQYLFLNPYPVTGIYLLVLYIYVPSINWVY
jgi:hypothetical protein